MAELLVRTVDVNHDEPFMDALHEKSGEVIVVCPDGWIWSDAERNHPGWRIISVPDLSESAASVFLAPGRVMPGSGWIAPRRAFRIDIELLGDGPKTAWDIDRCKVRVAPIEDPRVIGGEQHRIG